MPSWVTPQLATLADRVPAGGTWIHEIKYDGYRIFAYRDEKRIRLVTRNNNEWTDSFPTLAGLLKELPARQAILDGEVVALDDKGRPDFQLLQNALSAGGEKNLVYYAFDLLYLDGFDLRDAPLLERKKALAGLFAGAPTRLRYSDHLDGNGEKFFRQTCELALEGIISKRGDAPYRSGRGRDWLKVKCLLEQEFVVCGWTDPAGSRALFGSLLLGVRQNGNSLDSARDKGLRYAGKVGTGFTGESLRDIHSKLRRLAASTPPFKDPPKGAEGRRAHWVKPELVAEVAFTGWTQDGVLRHPAFHGLRKDKPAKEVVREKALHVESPKARPAAKARASDEIAGVRLTHPGRVLYPDQGITKKDLAEFYVKIADRALPHMVGRPLAIVRCPDGQGTACFFQKHTTQSFHHPAIKSVTVKEKSGSEETVYIEDLAGLVALVQLGGLEIHPWGCRIGDVETPDTMTFDLDPSPGVRWADVVKAALEIRDRLTDYGLPSFAKTSGGKGFHVVVPLKPAVGWEEMKAFSRYVSEEMVHDSPERFTVNLSKAARGRRIFIDYLRNGRGATAAAAYSTRARPGAPVATPVAWSEVKPSLQADRWNVKNLPARLSKVADPWRDYEKARVSLLPSFKKVVEGKGGRHA